jgi:hypothetical protein
MTRPLAIAAVTRTLAALLEAALHVEDNSFIVSTLPPDKANSEVTDPNRLNLFLFQVSTNAAWLNTDLPTKVRAGELARPPLALNLSYMLTAYGDPGPEEKNHRILGIAMKFLNDHPLLMPDDIRAAFPDTGLEEQIERLKITPRVFSLEEMVRMWGTFMTQYRISVAYELSVVLIDSAPLGPAALPVLRRGDPDQGVFAEAGLPPQLSFARPPEMMRRGGQTIYQPAIRLGERLTLEGDRLPREGGLLQVRSLNWGERWAAIDGVSSGARSNTVEVALPDPPPEPSPPLSDPPPPKLVWAPGVYTAALLVQRPGVPDVLSNAVPFALAPNVQVIPANAPPGDVEFTLRCAPPPRPGQQLLALLPGQQPLEPSSITPPASPDQPAVVTFRAAGLPIGQYVVRLRIDGVDSLPYRVLRAPNSPPRLVYDPAQLLMIA